MIKGSFRQFVSFFLEVYILLLSRIMLFSSSIDQGLISCPFIIVIFTIVPSKLPSCLPQDYWLYFYLEMRKLPSNIQEHLLKMAKKMTGTKHLSQGPINLLSTPLEPVSKSLTANDAEIPNSGILRFFLMRMKKASKTNCSTQSESKAEK